MTVSPSLNCTFSRYPVIRACTSTRSIAWMRPTKSATFAIGLRAAATVPTGTAAGSGCCAKLGAASAQIRRATPIETRIAVPLLSTGSIRRGSGPRCRRSFVAVQPRNPHM